MFRGLRPYLAIVESQFRVIAREVPELISIVLIVYMFIGVLYLGGRLIGSGNELFSAATGYDDPFRYQLVGVSIIAVSMVVLSSMSQFANTEMLSGRIDSLSLTPVSVNIAIAVSSIPFLLAMLLVFGLSISPVIAYALSSYGFVSVALSIAALVVGMVPVFIFGVLISMIVLVYKAPQIVNLVQALFFILSGALYPIYVLPHILRLAAGGLPITHVIEVSRSLLLAGAFEDGFRGFYTLAVLSLVYVALGYILVRRFGSLLRYRGV